MGNEARKRGWRSRGYMPHLDGFTCIQHITFHLADSLPREAIEQIDIDIARLPEEERPSERRRRLHAWIDRGYGCGALARPDLAEIAQDAILHHDAAHYRVYAWCIMPNHVHALVEVGEGWSLGRVVGSWKSWIARHLADAGVPKFQGRIWHREYWDRYMRDERHFRQTMDYIHENPVKAGLAVRAEDFAWSSARLRQG